MFILLFSSCEKAIEFAPRDPEPKLVVDATIETNEYPVVYLSQSLNFFSQISLGELAGSFVRGARVEMSNGNITLPLREFEVPIGSDYSLVYYTFDTAVQPDAFRGEEGTEYSLTVEVNGEVYTAVTTIPVLAKTVDSLYYEETPDEEDSSKVILYGRFTDPPGFGNYIRYFTSVNGGPFLPGLNSVFDDQVIDGKTYSVQIEQGVDRNTEIDFENYSYFEKGDLVRVKFCNVDREVFDFWRTMEYSYSSIGNPFSSPTKIDGNISNGALGYFGGYAVQYAFISIPE